MKEHPFFEYAADHWGDNARGQPETALHESILAFFQDSASLRSALQTQYYGLDHYSALQTSSFPLLHVTVSFKLTHVTKLLLKDPCYFDLNAKDSLGKDALHWAVERGSKEIVELLVGAGMNVTSITDMHRPVLFKSVVLGHDGITELLLVKCGNGLITDEVLHCAIGFNQLAVIKGYLATNSDSAGVASRANHVLLNPASHSKPGILKLAIKYGADVNARYEDVEANRVGSQQGCKLNECPGPTAIFEAVVTGCDKAVALLLSHGASVDLKDRTGLNLIQVAVSSQRSTDDLFNYISSYGKNPTKAFAVKNGHRYHTCDQYEIACQFFLRPADDRTKYDVRLMQRSYLGLLLKLYYCGAPEEVVYATFSLLLDPSSIGRGLFDLHDSLETHISDRLIDPFDDVVLGYVGQTLVIKGSQNRIVELLLKRGADTAVCASNAMTVLHLAIYHDQRLAILLNNGLGFLKC